VKTRPAALFPIAMLLTAAALALPAQVIALNGLEPWDLDLAFAGLAPLNWALFALCLGQAALVARASVWSLPVGAALVGVAGWNNFLIWDAGVNFSAPELGGSFAALIGLHAPLLRAPVRRVLFNPQLRWWRTPRRQRASLRAVVRPVTGGELVSRTVDVSAGGAFVELDRALWTLGHSDAAPGEVLKPGMRCAVRLALDPLHTLRCTAEVVRVAERRGRYPHGVGIRFTDLSREQRRQLDGFLDRVPAEPFGEGPRPA
jgi:hypothetical protein